LPVELDASSRAKKLLYQYNIVDQQELSGVSSVLSAAAWTYVVAAIAAILQLTRWILILVGRRN
jgi:Zn-dependent membrane protease YugP